MPDETDHGGDDKDDEEVDQDDELIFAIADYLIQLFKRKNWFANGTFKTAPSIFYQLFTVPYL